MWSMRHSSFNSKLVRLKGCIYDVDNETVLFQFQTGSIKSDFWSFSKALSVCFNSKLVRLKAGLPCPSAMSMSRFNSKLVRLKVRGSCRNPRCAVCFNSKLVRLKAPAGTTSRPRVPVSIPNWFD